MSVTDGTWSGIGGRMAKSCETCEFFYTEGQCRFNPPTFVAVAIYGGMEVISRFPSVHKDDWCGKYKQNSVVKVTDSPWDR